MEVKVSFPKNNQVKAKIDGWELLSDQPVEKGGDNEAPSPYIYFLVALATCGGYFLMRFLKTRNIDLSQVDLTLNFDYSEEMMQKGESPIVEYKITVPRGFDEKNIEPLRRAVMNCMVKKTIEAKPKFEVNIERQSSS